ncbi:hypothetical protein HDU77_009505 [Chytriomyces hyalinus]|nr:hypothetical protein HDU77_009505 [Chytriomyces hyalinus]
MQPQTANMKDNQRSPRHETSHLDLHLAVHRTPSVADGPRERTLAGTQQQHHHHHHHTSSSPSACSSSNSTPQCLSSITVNAFSLPGTNSAFGAVSVASMSESPANPRLAVETVEHSFEKRKPIRISISQLCDNVEEVSSAVPTDAVEVASYTVSPYAGLPNFDTSSQEKETLLQTSPVSSGDSSRNGLLESCESEGEYADSARQRAAALCVLAAAAAESTFGGPFKIPTSKRIDAPLLCSSGSKKFVCDFDGCLRTFASGASLRSHVICHTGARPFVCEYEGCNKSYTTNNRLKVHMRLHTKEKPYACDFPGCDYRTTQKCSLTPHMVRHLDERAKREIKAKNERSVPCVHCGKTYKSVISLNQHCFKDHNTSVEWSLKQQ